MKTVEEFVKKMVKIEFIEDSNCFGHYPFQLLCENKDGGFEINALALGGDVDSCYRKFAKYKKEGAKRIYLSLDFPKGGDIENDYVVIFTFENNKVELFAIPYEINGGKILDIIKDSTQLDFIKSDILSYL
jgi:hypothetical protein